jgi:hypothetical protein
MRQLGWADLLLAPLKRDDAASGRPMAEVRLFNSKDFKQLRLLYLRRTGVSDAGGRAIAKGPARTSDRTLTAR